jgi:hypothetical protein
MLIFNDYDRFSKVVNTLVFFLNILGAPGPKKVLFLLPAVSITICQTNRWIPCVNTLIPKKGKKTLGVAGQKEFGPDLLAGGQVVVR